MALPRQEIESPMLMDWEFEDELGIVMAIGRFVVPNYNLESVGSRKADFIVNDGRKGTARTITLQQVDSKEIRFQNMPYNYVMELKYRVGVRFRIRDCYGDYLWTVLDSMEIEPIAGYMWARTEQLYNITAMFSQVSPI